MPSLSRYLPRLCIGLIVLFGSNSPDVLSGGRQVCAQDLFGEEQAYPAHERIHATTPPCCRTPTVGNSNYLIVSTMDGKIRALDVLDQGSQVWEVDMDDMPLMRGNLGKVETPVHNRYYSLVPALDGALYMYSNDQRILEPIPMNSDMLLKSSVRLGQDTVAGGRTVSTTGVDPLTGNIRYHCSTHSCHNREDLDPFATLVFRRHTSSLRAVNSLSGSERWNLSVGEYDASLVVDIQDNDRDENFYSGVRFLLQPPNGVVTALNSCGGEMWSVSLGGHIAKVWHMVNAQLNEVSIFKPENVHTMSLENTNSAVGQDLLLYLGTMENDHFIIHSDMAKKELQRLEAKAVLQEQPHSALAISGRPNVVPADPIEGLLTHFYTQTYSGKRRATGNEITSLGGRELQIVFPSSQRDDISIVNEKNMKQASFDGTHSAQIGFFVAVPAPSSPTFRQIAEDKYRKYCEATSERVKTKFGLSDSQVFIGNAILSIVSLAMASACSVIAFGFFRRQHQTREAVTDKVSEISETTSRPEKIASTRTTSTGPSICGLPTPPLTDPPTPEEPKRMARTSSNNSGSFDYVQKLVQDFENFKVIGCGGFGVVIEARNKLDLSEYAIKRIAVDQSDVAIQRVLREVRAMAKLEHSGIIRYYQSWIEHPPEGHKDEIDVLLGEFKRQRQRDGEQVASHIAVSTTNTKPISSIEEIDEASKLELKSLSTIPSEDGSWMESSVGGAEKVNFDASSSSSSSSSSDDDSDSAPADPAFKEESDDVLFFKKSDSSSGNNNRSLRRRLPHSRSEKVVVTSINEELLPTVRRKFAYVYIQMQLCQEQTLHMWLSKHKNLEQRPLDKMKEWMVQLSSAVNYIHAQGLIHRDIKPHNIFFGTNETLKIGDLGLVTRLENCEEQELPTRRRRTDSQHTDNVGTKGYMSPEQLKNRPYTYKVDVFSLGLVFCELVVPFGTAMERITALKQLQHGEEITALKDRPEEAKFVYWLTSVDPVQRPSCAEILDSDYLKSCRRFY